MGISLLVVASPIFLFMAHQVRRMLTADPTKLGSPTRKWLTYIALFIAAAFLIGDVATLVMRHHRVTQVTMGEHASHVAENPGRPHPPKNAYIQQAVIQAGLGRHLDYAAV